MNKHFLKFCNSINYRTYNVLEDTSFFSYMAMLLANMFLFSAGPALRIGVLSTMTISEIIYMLFRYSDGRYYTKDVVETRKMYQEFLNNYIKLNKEFNLNEPISIYTLYNYMRVNGYLSKNKEFKSDSLNVLDVGTLYGVDVLGGNGVCRHIASMYSDILNNMGIESLTVGCHLRDGVPLIEEVNKEDYDRKKVLDFINKCVLDEKQRKYLLENIRILEENGIFFNIYFKFDSSKKTTKVGNHAISYALYNDKNYYLDPTQERIYKLKDPKGKILYDCYDDMVLIKDSSLRTLNGIWNPNLDKTCKKMFNSFDSISLEEEEQITDNVKKICLENIDMFDKFYNDNKELYGEILNVASKVKVKKRG